jgi:hypothetical protein
MKLFITAIVSLIFTSTHAQNGIQELPEGKYANYKLTKVNHALVSGINHLDLDGTSTKYQVSLDFGKNTLNIQLHETATGKLVWGYYGMKRSVNFKPNYEKSNSVSSLYEFSVIDAKNKTECQVSYMLGANSITIMLSYNETDPVTKKVIRSLIASGEL